MDEIWISTSNGLCFEVSVKDIRTLEKEIFERIFSGEPSICLDYFHSDVNGKKLVRGGLVLMLDKIVSISSEPVALEKCE